MHGALHSRQDMGRGTDRVSTQLGEPHMCGAYSTVYRQHGLHEKDPERAVLNRRPMETAINKVLTQVSRPRLLCEEVLSAPHTAKRQPPVNEEAQEQNRKPLF